MQLSLLSLFLMWPTVTENTSHSSMRTWTEPCLPARTLAQRKCLETPSKLTSGGKHLHLRPENPSTAGQKKVSRKKSHPNHVALASTAAPAPPAAPAARAASASANRDNAYERRQGNMRDHLANFEESLGNFGKSLTGIVETQTAHTNALNLLQPAQQQTLDHLRKIHESGLVAKLAEQAAGLEKAHRRSGEAQDGTPYRAGQVATGE